MQGEGRKRSSASKRQPPAKAIRASDVARFLNAELVGADVMLDGFRSLDNICAGSVVFAKRFDETIVERLNGVDGSFALVTPEYQGRLTGAHALSLNPRKSFLLTLEEFFAPPKPAPTVASTARIGKRVTFGARVALGHYCVVGDDCEIGDDCRIDHHVVLAPRTVVGAKSVIRSSTVIGFEGFGFETERGKSPLRVPHYGRVVIGSNVEIGALCSIARGTLDDTKIGDNVKIDDHVFLAHNVKVGANTLVIAGAEVSGSVTIGEDAWIGPQVSVLNQVTIGDHAMIGIGAVVLKNVEANAIMVGNPAKVLRRR